MTVQIRSAGDRQLASPIAVNRGEQFCTDTARSARLGCLEGAAAPSLRILHGRTPRAADVLSRPQPKRRTL